MQNESELTCQILTDLIGRPSRWSGVLLLTDAPAVRGAKPFRCDIVLNESPVGEDVRWRTLIHEMLHTFSAGYFLQDYQEFRGWEEGVIEHLQRLLRPVVLQKAGTVVPETVFEAVEQDHDYQEYLEAPEDIRAHFGGDPVAFYLLLAVLIRDRRQFVFGLGMSLPLEKRRAFSRSYSASDATLKTGVTP